MPQFVIMNVYLEYAASRFSTPQGQECAEWTPTFQHWNMNINYAIKFESTAQAESFIELHRIEDAKVFAATSSNENCEEQWRLVMSEGLKFRCIEVISEYAQVHLELFQFERMMEENPELQDQLVYFNSPDDTADREDLIDALARMVTGKEWPMNGAPNWVHREFKDSFLTQLNAKGYSHGRV